MGLSDLVEAFDGELLALFLIGTYFVAGIGSALSPGLRQMYETSVRPGFAPPPKVAPWFFGLAWTLLYTLSGIAAYLVRIEGGPWTSGSDGNLAALIFYSVLQVVLTTYTIFSSRRWHWFAAAIVAMSLVLAITTAALFAYNSTTAAFFMGVLAGWLLFALTLQVSFAWLNGGSSMKKEVPINLEPKPRTRMRFGLDDLDD